MRKCLTVILTCLAATLLPTMLHAEIKINARVGFPSGGNSSRYKGGFWAPIYVQIRNESENKSDLIPAGSKVVVEMPDSDGMESQFVQTLPSDIQAGGTEDVIVVARPVMYAGNFDISILGKDDRRLGTVKVPSTNGHIAVEANSVLYLAIGSLIPQLDSALKNIDKKEKEEVGAGEPRPYDYAYLTQVADLPKRWSAYQGVDVIVLTTSNQDFVHALLRDEDRIRALVDWVKHGGKLIISLGATNNLESRLELFRKLNLLNVEIDSQPQVWSDSWGLNSVADWVRTQGSPVLDKFINPAGEGKSIDVARLKIRAASLSPPGVVVPKPHDPGVNLQTTDLPLIVQGKYGLGRVMLVAFDLDDAPFTNWAGQASFWTAIQRTFGPKYMAPVANQVSMPRGFQEQSDLNTKLKRGLETIDVPVVSFGWVALFIVLYILVVGPLDYFFLKKVVKRLELTWITFPVIVITISIGAYIVAYLLKGKDLRINKVDVVDIFLDADPERAAAKDQGWQAATVATQASGSSWFTLFSPQIKRYTIGIEPAFPDWVPEGTMQANPYGIALASMNRSDEGSYGDPQSSGGLFRGQCRYEEDGSGMSGVAIQVWQTKTFTADWQSNLAGQKKYFTAGLQRDQNNNIKGWVRSGLPVPLKEAVLLYGGDYFDLGTLAPDKETSVPERPAGSKDNWFRTPFFNPNFKNTNRGRGYKGMDAEFSSQEAPCSYMKSIMFSDQGMDPHHVLANSHFRDLDQGWRIGGTDEAIIVGRVQTADGESEELTSGTGMATRLWLDELPRAGVKRPSLSGKMSQDTFVRIFIPVFNPAQGSK
jgi:hypothetical protein